LEFTATNARRLPSGEIAKWFGRNAVFGGARSEERSSAGLDELLLHPDNVQGGAEIFVMRSDGSNLSKLTENQWEDATPAWKPSAKK
jgi:hypothetical protein